MKNLFVILTTTLFACHTPGEQAPAENEAGGIFPVSSFVAGQVREADSLGVPVLKYTTKDNVTDTTLISTEEFRKLAMEFMKPDIASAGLSKHYKESSFADQSVPSATLTYSTGNKELEVQRLDVLIDPDPVLTDKVKSLYLEKSVRQDSISIAKKLFWKAGNSFQIITIRRKGSHPPETDQVKVVWNLND